MQNARKYYFEVIGLVVIAVTALIFFINVDYGKVELISFIFIIFAEFSMYFGILKLNGKEKNSTDKIFKISAYFVLGIYLVAAVFISMYFILEISTNLKALVTWQLIMIAMAYIALCIIDLVAKSIAKSNKDSLLAAENIRNIIDKSYSLSEKYKKSEYNKELSNLYDTINYADFSVKVNTDDLIAEKIEELGIILSEESEEKDQIINSLIEEILSLIKQRQIEVKSLKSVDI